ncbi:MAG: TonB family protein [candidate division Zixibacteria bacterium]|nr:TonB family protein [candidate division Zixibacteria bacterium]
MKFGFTMIQIVIVIFGMILLSAPPLLAENFRVIRMDNSELEDEGDSLSILIAGGHDIGLVTGMSGIFHLDTKESGLAGKVEVIRVGLSESDCMISVTARHRAKDYTEFPPMRISIDIPYYDRPQLRALADSALLQNNTPRAWYLLGRLCEQNQTDSIAQKELQECCAVLDSQQNQKIIGNELEAERDKVSDYVELALTYVTRGRLSRAYRQVNRALRADELNSDALSLKEWIEDVRPEATQCGALAMAGPVLRTDFPNICDWPDGPDRAETVLPRILHKVQPEYPQLAEQGGIVGTVWVGSFVDEEGEVVRARVLKSSGHESLDIAAVKAAYQYLFAPATAEGKPIGTWVSYKVEFTL